MKVTRSMLHSDLKPFYWRFRHVGVMVRFRWLALLINFLLKHFAAGKNIDGLDCEERFVPSADGGSEIRVRIFKPREQKGPLPILVYLHGGGYVLGNPEMSAAVIHRFIESRPCIVVAPDYRKAYTAPFPAGFNDCYDTLVWAANHAHSFGGRADAVIVAGHSAGGGLTAAVTMKARDCGDVEVAFQMPIYPMIDDLQPSDLDRQIDVCVWNTKTNGLAWSAYLAHLHSRGDVIPAYAAPARCIDFSGLPPTITFVGSLEPFYWETKSYVAALRAAGVEVAFEEFENCFHGFDTIAAGTNISNAALDYTFTQFADFYDRYTVS
jgi:acetyl esterase/lipase